MTSVVQNQLSPQRVEPERFGSTFFAAMESVSHQVERAAQSLEPDAVHDLRVALRRCRSVADSFRSLDPDPDWKTMKKTGGKIFKSLGNLRDIQVMREWLQKLAPPDDFFNSHMDQSLAVKENSLKRAAKASLDRFDPKQWQAWATRLSGRAGRVRPGSLSFQYVALERWHEAHELHRHALRNRSQTAWHALRVGIKRLRYTVENFLPQQHQQWSKDLKKLQDALGEVHDLDVLWAEIRSADPTHNQAIGRWRISIEQERRLRLEIYRKKMVGPESLWRKWRSELPERICQQRALLSRAQTQVAFSGASVMHARHVLRLALQMHGGLVKAGIFGDAGESSRKILELGTMLHEVGRFRSGKGHHKHSGKMVTGMPVPVGWTDEQWNLVAALARYHRGALPHETRAKYKAISVSQRKTFLELASVLRVANALDSPHSGDVRSVKVVRTPETINLVAAGYAADLASAADIAIAKHFLEIACGLPVVVRAETAKEVKARRTTPKRTRAPQPSPRR